MKLESVKGISDSDAETLRSNGVNHVRDLAVQSCHNIEEMGLEPALVANALRARGYSQDMVKAQEINYECEYCDWKHDVVWNLEEHEKLCRESDDDEEVEFEHEVINE
jgi:hypothetical protein